jgi:protein involved in polysaccharide export with SLBB domain
LPAVLIVAAATVTGQSIGLVDRTSGSSMVISAGGEREVLIEVQVWGQVARPGMFKVPVSTDAVSLISYAGGPTEYAALSRVRLVRNGFPRGKSTKLNLDRYAGTGDRSAVPMLESGDVVIVPTRYSHRVSQFTSFVSQLAVVITAYLVIAGKR